MRAPERLLGWFLLVSILAPCGARANASNGSFIPLREAREPELQAALERTVRELGFEPLVRKRRLAVALAGITDPDCPRLAALNGDHMMYAASLPKIAILLAAFRRIDAGQMKLDTETEQALTEMIRKSSNRSATRMLNRVGREYVLEVLLSPRLGLYDPRYKGGLWLGKEYGPKPAWRRDPLHGISHGATAIQVARFYYMLELGQLASPASTARMKAMLGDPGIRHKFVAGLTEVYPYAQIRRKSGTWRDYHADSAVVERDGKRYVAVALSQDANGEDVLRRLIVALDALIFEVPQHCPVPAAPGGRPG